MLLHSTLDEAEEAHSREFFPLLCIGVCFNHRYLANFSNLEIESLMMKKKMQSRHSRTDTRRHSLRFCLGALELQDKVRRRFCDHRWSSPQTSCSDAYCIFESIPSLFLIRSGLGQTLNILTALLLYCFLFKHFALVCPSSSHFALQAFWIPFNHLKEGSPLSVILSTSVLHLTLRMFRPLQEILSHSSILLFAHTNSSPYLIFFF